MMSYYAVHVMNFIEMCPKFSYFPTYNMHRNFTMLPATVICVESLLSTSPYIMYMDPTHVQVIFTAHIFKMGGKTTNSVNLF